MKIRDLIQEEVNLWSRLGHHAVLQRFILKHGREGTSVPLPRDIHYGRVKECFKNATNLVLQNPERFSYCEGYVYSPEAILLIHHAWAVDREGNYVDNTIRHHHHYSYFGLSFDRETLIKELMTHKVYGILDYGIINTKLMQRLDPTFQVRES